MATPTVPASQSAAVEAAKIRAGSTLYDTNLETITKIVMGKREGWKDELLQLYKSVTTTRGELGKLGQDTFVELADLSKDYYKVASAGNVNPKDALDAYIKILGLEAKINKDMGTADKQLLMNLQTRADAIAPRGSPEWNKSVAQMYLDTEANTAVSPYRVATYDAVSNIIKGDVASVSGDPRAAALSADVQQRKEAAARLSSTASVIKRDVGDLAKLSQIANSGNSDLIQQTVSQIAPTLDQAITYAQKFPGKSDIAARLQEDEQRIQDLKTKLDEDPMLAIQSFLKSSAKTEVRDVDFYKTIGSTKFQRWAASNNLQVGKMRPATTDADKQKVGYIPELNAVYEPGPDDQRALVVAHNQSTMRPGSQLFTRRGLAPRRNVEVQVGTKGAERDVVINAETGKEATPEEVTAQTTFVRMANVDGDTVFIRADGSGRSGTKEYTQDDLAYASEKPLTPEQAKTLKEKFQSSLFKTEKRPGEATGVQTLRGRETAMLPTDPADTLYVIETTDGRRVPVRESQLVKETVIGKAEPAAEAKLIEEPRMGLRKPLAMLRARGARLREQAAAEEAKAVDEGPEAPVGPLGRATEADKRLMSAAEVKELPGTQVIELPARAGGEPSGRGSRAPFTKTGIYEYEQRQKEAKEGLRVPLAEMRQQTALENLRQPLAEMRRDTALENLREPLLRMRLAENKRDQGVAGLSEQYFKEEPVDAGFIRRMPDRSNGTGMDIRMPDRSNDTAFAVRPGGTASAGRGIRQATGTEQTGKAAATVGAVIPPIASGTPKNAPVVEATWKGQNYTMDATPMFTPAELAEMNAAETPAQRRARLVRELRAK